eukprot:scaffold2954_cov195-Alexandrium_tamarense.AAC.19
MAGIEGKGYHRTYYCSLRDEPTRTILRDELGLYHDTEDSVGEGRALRLLSTRQDEMDPPFVENGYRFLSEITSIPDGTSSESSIQTDTNQHFAVKACNCFQWLVDKDPFCPADSTYCSSSINYYSNDYLIKCSRSTQLQSAARFTWKYTYFIYAFVIAIVFCSRSGHHAIKYLVSCCIPQLNNWIVEEILRNDTARRHQRNSALLSELNSRIREEGFVSGYRLKTKVFRCSCGEERGGAGELEVADVENLPQSPIAENLTQQSVSTHIENDNTPQSHIDYDDSQMCSICILPLEHGDRIADLDCNHYYHSDCLSEWIKTKNTCPLCQQEGIAEEIRCYNLQSEDPNAVAADAFNVNAEVIIQH